MYFHVSYTALNKWFSFSVHFIPTATRHTHLEMQHGFCTWNFWELSSSFLRANSFVNLFIIQKIELLISKLNDISCIVLVTDSGLFDWWNLLAVQLELHWLDDNISVHFFHAAVEVDVPCSCDIWLPPERVGKNRPGYKPVHLPLCAIPQHAYFGSSEMVAEVGKHGSQESSLQWKYAYTAKLSSTPSIF